MNKQTNQQQQATRTKIKIAVLLVIIICTAALLTIYVVNSDLRRENDSLKQQGLALEEEKQDLQNYIDHAGTDEGVNEVAKNEQGMVKPGTIIYDFD